MKVCNDRRAIWDRIGYCKSHQHAYAHLHCSHVACCSCAAQSWQRGNRNMTSKEASDEALQASTLSICLAREAVMSLNSVRREEWMSTSVNGFHIHNAMHYTYVLSLSPLLSTLHACNQYPSLAITKAIRPAMPLLQPIALSQLQIDILASSSFSRNHHQP